MIIPESLLLNAIRSLVKMLGDDWNAQLDKTKTMLYDLFYLDDNGDRLGYDKYYFYDQAVSVFTRNVENPKKVTINLGYNMEQAKMLAIHILMPTDAPGRYDAIGQSVEYLSGSQDTVNQTEKQIQTRTFLATYQLLITGDNQHEIYLLYWYLKNCFVMLSDHLELMGLHNLRFSGADIRLDADGMVGPFNIFHRTLNITFDYELRTKSNFLRQMASKVQLLFCASLDVDYDDATNNGGLIEPVIPPTVGSVSYRNFYAKRIVIPNTFSVVIPFTEHRVLFPKDVVILDPSDEMIDADISINQTNLTVIIGSAIDLNGYLVTIF